MMGWERGPSPPGHRAFLQIASQKHPVRAGNVDKINPLFTSILIKQELALLNAQNVEKRISSPIYILFVFIVAYQL